MTLPHERTRAVAQTYEFLGKLARNSNLPEEVRRDALDLLRHFPNQYDVTRPERMRRGCQRFRTCSLTLSSALHAFR